MKFLSLLNVLLSALVFCASVCLSVSVSKAEGADSLGREFLFGFLPSPPTDRTLFAELRLVSPSAASVRITFPAINPVFDERVDLQPDQVEVVELPAELAVNGWRAGEVQNNAISLSSQNEFSAVMMKRYRASSDASRLFPVDVLGDDYIVVTNEAGIQEVVIDGQPDISGDVAMFNVIATQDNTRVRIDPVRDLVGGYQAGVPFEIVLNRGEGFLGMSVASPLSGDLTGTIVTADQPVSVTNGNSCTLVPPRVLFCDALLQMALPTDRWDQTVLAADLPYRTSGSYYRILAAEDETTVQRNGDEIAVLNRGEFIELANIIGPQAFEANKPIQVAQLMTGAEAPGSAFNLGDPSLVMLTPVSQYVFENIFSPVDGDQYRPQVIRNLVPVDVPGQFVSIIADNRDIEGGTLLYDDEPLSPGIFLPIGQSGFSYTFFELQQGSHVLQSRERHTVKLIGVNAYDSYLYSGEFLFSSERADLTPPICFLSPQQSSAGDFFGVGFDGRATEDVNSNSVLESYEDRNQNGIIDFDTGIASITLSDGSSNLALQPFFFTPGGAVAFFAVRSINPDIAGSGSVVVTDGAGNECIRRIDIAPSCFTLDFEKDGEGNPLKSGAKVQDAFSVQGVSIQAFTRNGRHKGLPIVFDSSDPKGISVKQDPDLGTPNSAFGGPGVGSGGVTTNQNPLHNVLVRAQHTEDKNRDGLVDRPNDNGSGSTFVFDFPPGTGPVCVESLDLLDIDTDEKVDFTFHKIDGRKMNSSTRGVGNNGVQTVDFEPNLSCSTGSFSVVLSRSGALDNIKICRSR